MPIITQYLYVKWRPKNKEWYESKGYTFSKFNAWFKIMLKDMYPESSQKVRIECDFCHKVLEKEYKRCIDVCNCDDPKCIQKRKEYTVMKRYGVKNVLASKKIRDKIKATLKERYNVEKVSDIPNFKEKIIATRKAKGLIQTSKQQNRLFRLFGGELNYPVKGYAADIALIRDRIILEYNGSGHDLTVQRQQETRDHFDNKEQNRLNDLIEDQWNVIIFISKNDKLPTNIDLKQLFLYAKYSFTPYSQSEIEPIHWVKIDFDNNSVTTAKETVTVTTAIRQSLTLKRKGAYINQI